VHDCVWSLCYERVECDIAYGLVTREVDILSELAANISTVADSVVLSNSSTTNDDTFYERLQQTRSTLEDLLSFVSCFCCVLTVTDVVDK